MISSTKYLSFFLTPLFIFFFTGCSVTRPENNATDAYIKGLEQRYEKAMPELTGNATDSNIRQKILDPISTYQNASLENPQDRYKLQISRDRILFQLMSMVDDFYYRYEAQLQGGKSLSNILTDSAIIGLSGAASLAGGEELKSILSVAAAGLAGSRLSIDKNLFADKALPIVLAKARAMRKERQREILYRMSQSVDLYPLEAGIKDVIEYFNNGTLVSALQALSGDAQNSEQNAQKGIDEVMRSRERADIYQTQALIRNSIRRFREDLRNKSVQISSLESYFDSGSFNQEDIKSQKANISKYDDAPSDAINIDESWTTIDLENGIIECNYIFYKNENAKQTKLFTESSKWKRNKDTKFWKLTGYKINHEATE